MNFNPAAAAHLAELDARFEGHVAELRRHADAAKAAIERSAAGLAERTAPPAPPDSFGAFDDEPSTETLHAPLLADTPLVATDDDGIPLWEDPS